MAFAFRLDTDLATGELGDGLADAEAEARTLDKVVEFDEAFKYIGLLVLGNACTGVLAVHVEPSILIAIAHTDMSLVGVLDSIGHEVGDDLLHATLVEGGDKRLVGIVLDEQ